MTDNSTDNQSAGYSPRPQPALVECPRCGMQYARGFDHKPEACAAHRRMTSKEWPPDMETK